MPFAPCWLGSSWRLLNGIATTLENLKALTAWPWEELPDCRSYPCDPMTSSFPVPFHSEALGSFEMSSQWKEVIVHLSFAQSKMTDLHVL